MKILKKYRVVLNYMGLNYEFYKTVLSERDALIKSVFSLEKALKLRRKALLGNFLYGNNNYHVEEV